MATIFIDKLKTVPEAQTLLNSANPGDQVLFERTGVWPGYLSITKSGTSSVNRIVYGAYGTGADPIITVRETWSPAMTAGNWVQYSANVWRIPFDVSANVVFRLWLTRSGVTTEARRAYDVPGLNATDNYHCSNSYADIYLYIPVANTNPTAYYSNIEWSGGSDVAMDVQNCSYYTIQNLDIRGGKLTSLILYGSDNFTIENCTIGLDMNRVALCTRSLCTNGTIRYNTIDSGNRYKWTYDVETYFQNGVADGLQIQTGTHDLDVYGNHFKDCGHSLVEVTNMYLSGPSYEAVKIGGLGMSNILIRENLFTGDNVNYCRAFGCDNMAARSLEVGQVTFTCNLVWNVPIQSQVNFDGAVVCYNVFRDNARNPCRPSTAYGPFGGILVAGYSQTSPRGMTFHNNTFVNLADQGIRVAHAAGYTAIHDNEFSNNIFVNCGYDSNNPENAGMAIVIENLEDPYTGGNNYEYNLSFRNNLFWKTGATAATPFIYDNRHVGAETMTAAQFQSAGNGFHGDVVSGNQVANPLLQGTDYYLGAGSPALTGGISFTRTTALKAGSSWPTAVLTETEGSPNWTLGAYGATTSTGTTTTTSTVPPTTTTTTVVPTTTTTTLAPTTTTTSTSTTTTLAPTTTTTTTAAPDAIQVRRRVVLV